MAKVMYAVFSWSAAKPNETSIGMLYDIFSIFPQKIRVDSANGKQYIFQIELNKYTKRNQTRKIQLCFVANEK